MSKLSKRTIILILIFMIGLFRNVKSQAVLNGVPVTFSMTGSTSYIPDIGGNQVDGYTLTLGYVQSSWLGVKFVSAAGNSDFLVLQINDFYSTNSNPLFTGHKITYTDCFINGAGVVNTDTITTKDISAYSFSNQKAYSLTMKRFSGSNSGQDWAANLNMYSLLNICFYTSSEQYDPNSYSNYSSACYYYEIDNLVSTFVGPLLKVFTFHGYNTSIYGYIDGPSLVNKVYFYQNTPLFTYSNVPAIAIEIGTTSGNYGQDFYAWSPISSEIGDYYGIDITSIDLDNNAKGFQNPALNLKHWNANPASQIPGLSSTSLRISFSRSVYTRDLYDKQMLSTFIFCLYLYGSGSINSALSDKSCEMVELSPIYTKMSFPMLLFQQAVTTVAVFVCIIFL